MVNGVGLMGIRQIISSAAAASKKFVYVTKNVALWTSVSIPACSTLEGFVRPRSFSLWSVNQGWPPLSQPDKLRWLSFRLMFSTRLQRNIREPRGRSLSAIARKTLRTKKFPWLNSLPSCLVLTTKNENECGLEQVPRLAPLAKVLRLLTIHRNRNCLDLFKAPLSKDLRSCLT